MASRRSVCKLTGLIIFFHETVTGEMMGTSWRSLINFLSLQTEHPRVQSWKKRINPFSSLFICICIEASFFAQWESASKTERGWWNESSRPEIFTPLRHCIIPLDCELKQQGPPLLISPTMCLTFTRLVNLGVQLKGRNFADLNWTSIFLMYSSIFGHQIRAQGTHISCGYMCFWYYGGSKGHSPHALLLGCTTWWFCFQVRT